MRDEEFDKLLKKQMQDDNRIPKKINQLFSDFESEVKMKKNNTSIKNHFKFAHIVAWIAGIIGGCGIVYATIIPTDWKINIANFINNQFGTTISSDEYNGGVQNKTIEEITSSDKENKEKYSQLLNADTYGIGDDNGGVLIESNYKQYDFNAKYDEDNITLKKYSDIIKIKMAMVNYTCLEELDTKNTILDSNGNVIKRTEPTLEQILKYQYDEFTKNWNKYYHNEKKNNEKLYYKITGMTLINGNNATDENYSNYSRAKKIKITFDGKNEEIVNLLDSSRAQFIDLSYVKYDISKPIQINIEVLETYKGNKSNDVYIADIQFGIDSNIPMSR